MLGIITKIISAAGLAAFVSFALPANVTPAFAKGAKTGSKETGGPRCLKRLGREANYLICGNKVYRIPSRIPIH